MSQPIVTEFWKASVYEPDSTGYQWLTDVYEVGRKDLWSRYATKLYLRLRRLAEQSPQWMGKLQYLLYEDQIAEQDAEHFGDLKGVLLQSKPDDGGFCRNPHMAGLQQTCEAMPSRQSVKT